jgi:copper resistance protein B
MHRSLILLFASAVVLTTPGLAQHAGHGATANEADAPTVPVADQPPHITQGWAPPVEDQMRFNYVILDRLEFSSGKAPDALTWDAQGWYGGDYNKLWWKAEGDTQLSGRAEGEGELQTLYSRLIAAFWDVQAGLRYDWAWSPGKDSNRAYAVLGLEGLAPYWFEIEPAFFLSENGELSARLSATYEILLTQRIVLQPRLDLNAAFSDAPEFSVGSGFNDVEIGLRLRYEISRQVAPYLGVAWKRQLGKTADLTRAAGDSVKDVRFVIGIRVWW